MGRSGRQCNKLAFSWDLYPREEVRGGRGTLPLLLGLGETGPERTKQQLCFASVFQLERLRGRYCLPGYRAIWINLEMVTSRLQTITRKTQTDPWGTLLVTSVHPDSVSLTSTVQAQTISGFPIQLTAHPAQRPPAISVTRVRKLSSVVCWNVLDCLCPAGLSFQEVLGWLKFSLRTRGCKHKAAAQCPQSTSSSCSSWPGGLQQRPPTMSPVMFCSLILPHELSWLLTHSHRAPGPPTVLLHRGWLPLLIFSFSL